MEYTLEGRTFSVSYQGLREQYLIHCNMTDEEFIKNLPSALHLATVICYFKETPAYICLCDIGIIHELVHLLHIPEDTQNRLRDIRKDFEFQLKLA